MKINQERINKIRNDFNQKYRKRFIKDTEVYNIENLEKLKGKQVLYLPNHLSHFDYIIIPIILNENFLPHPFITAGKNLDHWPTNKILQEETGAFFIDRKVLKNRKISSKKRAEIDRINIKLEEIVKNGNSFLDFVESGRSYNGKVMERGDTGILKRYLNFVEKNKKQPYGINIAIKYEPNTIESSCIHIASFFKNKVEKIYFFTDIYAFLKNYFSNEAKKPIVRVNFGEPYPLEEFAKKRDPEGLLNFVKEDVKKLYQQIS